jgi:hypothetical protein
MLIFYAEGGDSTFLWHTWEFLPDPTLSRRYITFHATYSYYTRKCLSVYVFRQWVGDFRQWSHSAGYAAATLRFLFGRYSVRHSLLCWIFPWLFPWIPVDARIVLLIVHLHPVAHCYFTFTFLSVFCAAYWCFFKTLLVFSTLLSLL